MLRFHDLLREATTSMHASLDENLRAAFGRRESYVAFLRASLGALSSIEPSILRLAPPALVSSAGRTERLSADLAELGAAPRPFAAWAFLPTSTAEAVGAAYVVEGSSLGGMVLAKQVDERLSLDGRALGYLRFHGAETGARWRSFLEHLEAWSDGATEDERTAAVRGARATFDAYRAAFADEGLTT